MDMKNGVETREGRDHVPLRVLSVGDRVTDDILQEDLEDAAGLLIDKTGDTLHTATTSETTNSLHKDCQRGDRCGMEKSRRTGFVIPWMLSRRILR